KRGRATHSPSLAAAGNPAESLSKTVSAEAVDCRRRRISRLIATTITKTSNPLTRTGGEKIADRRPSPELEAARDLLRTYAEDPDAIAGHAPRRRPRPPNKDR